MVGFNPLDITAISKAIIHYNMVMSSGLKPTFFSHRGARTLERVVSFCDTLYSQSCYIVQHGVHAWAAPAATYVYSLQKIIGGELDV